MKLLYVVARYGVEVSGGAEQHCRQFATRLAARGHQVQVVTSRAINAQTWEDAYPAGATDLEGVSVERLSTGSPRDEARFDRLSWEVLWSATPASPRRQQDWLGAQGPVLDDLEPYLASVATTFDAVIFFGYLFWPTWLGLRVLSGRVPTLLHATAHDERPLWLPLYDAMFHRPNRYAYSTLEEADLITRRVGRAVPGSVIGVGIDLDPGGDAAGFRHRYRLGDRPYVVCVGRVLPGKGAVDLHAWWQVYKQRRPGPLTLVLVGGSDLALPADPSIVTTGWVDDATRADAVAGAMALIQPSYFESFSMALGEAWAAGKPALVQAHAPVLAGQARRSGGAIAFHGYADFETAMDWLCAEPGLGRRLGAAGRRYVESRYRWDSVLSAYEDLLAQAIRVCAAPGADDR
ncbi:MAG: glycosyltransferase family 4 protein [Actinomycetota bacterium]|nr:glycosyltransferase family 4 protein [Actinomycetota bacterium]